MLISLNFSYLEWRNIIFHWYQKRVWSSFVSRCIWYNCTSSFNNKTDCSDIAEILLTVALNRHTPFKSLFHFKNHINFIFLSVWPNYFDFEFFFLQPDEKEQKEQKDFVELLTARVEGEDPEIVVDKDHQEEGNSLLYFL